MTAREMPEPGAHHEYLAPGDEKSSGGCVLYEKRARVEALLRNGEREPAQGT